MSEEVAIEDHVYDYLKEFVDAANDPDTPDEDSPFFGVVLHDTIYRPIDDAKPWYIQVGNCDADLGPSPGLATVEDFDADLRIITLARVLTADRADRKAARGKAVGLARAIAKLFYIDPTMGGRVNDTRVLKRLGDRTSIKSNPYALTNVPLIVNEWAKSGG